MNKKRYKELIDHIGEAIFVVRSAKQKSREKFVKFLVKNNFSSANRLLIDKIETGVQKLDFNQFAKICEFLETSHEQVIDIANLVAEEKSVIADRKLVNRGSISKNDSIRLSVFSHDSMQFSG